MIKIVSYGSGSQGNLYLVSNAETHIVLECGLNEDTINIMLNDLDLEYSDIDACITSHQHTDHSGHIDIFDLKDIPCYCTYETKMRYMVSDDNFHPLEDDKLYKIKNIQFIPIEVDHGSCQCFGFIFRDRDNMILFITDFMETKKKMLFPVNEIFIECNYLEDEWKKKNAIEDNSILLEKKYMRQINTHQSLENLIVHLKSMNLSKCDKITLIHISQDLGDRDIMKETIEEEFGIECVALLPDGVEY